MIYTVTANPSIDYIVQLDNLITGNINRSKYDTKLPGGKGINVSRILNEINCPTTALGFVGAPTGYLFNDLLSQRNLKSDFTSIKDDTRINVKIKATLEETEINGQGPLVTKEEQADLLNKLSNVTADDIVVVSGSLAKNLTEDFYLKLAKVVSEKKADFVIDTTGKALLDSLKFHPLVIKPNHHELAELFNVTINNNDDIIKYAHKLLKLGAKNVLVSMAGDGAILVTSEGNYSCNAPEGTVVNSVGAGDSMIAGFVGTYFKTKDAVESFHMGAACGSATAFSEDLATAKKIEEIYQKIEITKFEN